MKYFSHFGQRSNLAKYSVVAFSDIYIFFNYVYNVVYQDVILTIFCPQKHGLIIYYIMKINIYFTGYFSLCFIKQVQMKIVVGRLYLED